MTILPPCTFTPEELALFERFGPIESKPDPNESRIRAINDISQYAALSEEECAALGIEF